MTDREPHKDHKDLKERLKKKVEATDDSDPEQPARTGAGAMIDRMMSKFTGDLSALRKPETWMDVVGEFCVDNPQKAREMAEGISRTLGLMLDIQEGLPDLSAELRKHYQGEINAIARDLERDLGVGELDAEGRTNLIAALLTYDDDDDDGDVKAEPEPTPPRERAPVGVVG